MVDIERGLLAGGRPFRVDRAESSDVVGIVRLLSDDELGSGRESDDLEIYLRAFREVDADPHQFLAVVSPGVPGQDPDVTREPDATRDPDVICATMQLTVIPGLSRSGATRLQIEAVRVGPAARGLGLGSAMLRWAHDYGRARGASLSQLTTDARRTDAHRFYERLGYVASHVGMKSAL